MDGEVVKRVMSVVTKTLFKDQSMDNSSMVQMMVFVRMVFRDFTIGEEFLTLLTLKITTKTDWQSLGFYCSLQMLS